MSDTYVKKTKQELIEALQLAEKTYGFNHINTTDAMRDLALALSNEYPDIPGHPDLEPLCRRRLEIIEKHFGDESIEYSDASFSLAQSIEHAGRIEEAVPMLYRSWQLSKRLLGDDHAKTWPKHLTFDCWIDEMEKSGKEYAFDLTKASKTTAQKRQPKQEI